MSGSPSRYKSKGRASGTIDAFTLSEANMELRIGISGWRYKPWRGVFYPKKLPRNQELAYASRQVNSIEINGSFYSLQRPSSYQQWFAVTPEDFIFSVKGPRYITHIRRLLDCEIPLANFFASGVLHLKSKLGPLLWQLPPNFLFRDDVIENFLKSLPTTFSEAVKLAKKSDRINLSVANLDGLASAHSIRHALEVRHYSFLNPDFVELLRRYNIAIVFADTAGKWPYFEDLTSDFVYVRLHGATELYKSGYDRKTLSWWSKRIRLWRSGREPKDKLVVSEVQPIRTRRDIFVYFDNDIKSYAPRDSMSLNAFFGPKVA